MSTTVSIDVSFGEGTTPEAVAEEVERQIKERPRQLWIPRRAEAERFFANMAEEIKRAGGSPR